MTCKLVQQLSLLAPQLVIPAPPGAQLAGVGPHVPLTQYGMESLHVAPHPPQLFGSLASLTQTPLHMVSPGRHTHAPLWQISSGGHT
jgi:hypothetical protein